MSAFFGSLIERPRNQLQVIRAKMKVQKKDPRVVHGIQEMKQVLERQADPEIMTRELEHKV